MSPPSRPPGGVKGRDCVSPGQEGRGFRGGPGPPRGGGGGGGGGGVVVGRVCMRGSCRPVVFVFIFAM
jgi:hypothetical protein